MFAKSERQFDTGGSIGEGFIWERERGEQSGERKRYESRVKRKINDGRAI